MEKAVGERVLELHHAGLAPSEISERIAGVGAEGARQIVVETWRRDREEHYAARESRMRKGAGR